MPEMVADLVLHNDPQPPPKGIVWPIVAEAGNPGENCLKNFLKHVGGIFCVHARAATPRVHQRTV